MVHDSLFSHLPFWFIYIYIYYFDFFSVFMRFPNHTHVFLHMLRRASSSSARLHVRKHTLTLNIGILDALEQLVNPARPTFGCTFGHSQYNAGYAASLPAQFAEDRKHKMLNHATQANFAGQRMSPNVWPLECQCVDAVGNLRTRFADDRERQ